MDNITKITIAFCEGPHDTAFLYRILKTKCFEAFKDSLEQLPDVVGKFIISKNKTVGYDKLKIDSLKNDFVPYRIMFKNEELILLYSLGGDKDNNEDAKNKRLIILNHFLSNIKSKVTDTSNYGEAFVNDGVNYKFLFFYDADTNKDAKLTLVNKYMEKIGINETLNHNELKTKDGYSIGTYIFSDEEDTGALEDILFSLMKVNNDTIFNKAEEYYLTYFNKDECMNTINRNKRLTTKCTDGVPCDKRDNKKEEDSKKSIICIAGQLQKKGKSNVVIIEDSDYLTLEKINSSDKLQEIISFFEK